ncbi:MAG: hypothetical protein INF54_06280 [Roseomonas sp.]|nr:hypothetical protein [Roseomonas sp.]
MLWLKLLAPEVGKAILKKRQSEGLMPSALALLKGLPVGWGGTTQPNS